MLDPDGTRLCGRGRTSQWLDGIDGCANGQSLRDAGTVETLFEESGDN